MDVVDEKAPAVWNAEKASIVVGVVRNAREGGLQEGFRDEVFLPLTTDRDQPVMYAMLRTHTSASETAAGIAQRSCKHRLARAGNAGAHAG